MQRRLVALCFLMAPFLPANVDPLAASAAPSPASEVFSDAELIAGLAMDETSLPVFALPLAVDPMRLDEFIVTAATVAGSQPNDSNFLLSVIALPQVAEADLSQSPISYKPPQDPFNLWLLVLGASMAIAVVGGLRILRVWRT